MLKYLVCFFLTFSLNGECKGQLCICTIFKNDAKYLPEWIEFHSERGVEHFYLYNNASQDDYKIILDRYVQLGIVELFDYCYDYDKEADWTRIQCSAYMHCIEMIRKKFKWCAFLDTDEFLFSPCNKDIKKTLKDYDDCSAIAVNWVMYGTSNVAKIPDGEKITNHLLYRSKIEFEGNDIPKSIVKPKYVLSCENPHYFTMKKGHRYVNENKEKIIGTFRSKNSVKFLRINHYWTRDEDFFLNTKIPRRKRWDESIEKTLNISSQLNDVFDPILRE
jgi:hypothetical protein